MEYEGRPIWKLMDRLCNWKLWFVFNPDAKSIATSYLLPDGNNINVLISVMTMGQNVYRDYIRTLCNGHRDEKPGNDLCQSKRDTAIQAALHFHCIQGRQRYIVVSP